MKAFAKLLRLAAALVAAPAALTAQNPLSGLPVVPPATIVAAAQSCSNAVTTDHLDEQRLTDDRWVRSEPSAGGRPVDTPLRFFSRDSLLLTTMAGEATCIVLARIGSVRDYPAVRDGLTAS